MAGTRPSTDGNQHVALDINTEWWESVKGKAGKSRKPQAKPTIFRVPPSVRSSNPGAYEPNLVSIGPYHRGKTTDLEEIKWRLLHNYLSKVPDGSNNEHLRKLNDLEMRARNCYSEEITLDTGPFLEMLLLDGCFLVQIFMAGDDEALRAEVEYCNKWFSDLMFRDLLLLENQIPYFILEHLLYTLGMPEWDSSRLQRAALCVFASSLPLQSNFRVPEPPFEGFLADHLLHLFHQWILSVPKLEKASNRRCHSKVLLCLSNSSLSKNIPTIVPTATELAEAGVRIEAREANSFLDISFCKDQGKLEIPAIRVDDETNTVFANLVAWEQTSHGHGMKVTDYTMFLDGIIDTPRDVRLLHQKGIIHPCLGDDNAIASLFNKLGKDVVFSSEESYLKNVYVDLNAYCESRWPRWRAKAVHDYFYNPWAIISFLAAVLLIGLTILQSVFAVLGYYKA